MALKRIIKERDSYLKEDRQIEGVTVTYDDDLFNLYFSIEGPINTPYYGGKFHYKMRFPADYPFKPMKITSLQKVYHVSKYECILSRCNCCSPPYLNLGVEKWSPLITFWQQIESLRKCFYPEIFLDSDDIDTDSLRLYKKDIRSFTLNVQNTIAQEKSKEYILQYVAYKKFIQPFMNMNADLVYIDLLF